MVGWNNIHFHCHIWEISANLDAAADYVNESINAVTQFFGNLIDEIINPEKHYDNN